MIRSGRRGLALIAAVLIVLGGLAGPASAGDTRIVFIGSTTNRVLDITQPVSTGGVAMTSITVRNDGKQNLSHAGLVIGVDPAGALPTGVTIVNVSGADAGTCSVASDGRSLLCDFDALRKGTSRTISVLFQFDAVLDHALIRAAVRVAEQVNDNGANQDTFFADALVDVALTTCDNIATFVPPGQAKTISTDIGSCDGQSTALAIPGTGNGHIVRVAEETSSACAFGLSCFGDASVAQVDGGAGITPYLEWTISWPASAVGKVNLNKAGVIHFRDDGTPVALYNSKKDLCKGNGSDCIVSFGYSPDGSRLIAVFRTPTNGIGRGFG